MRLVVNDALELDESTSQALRRGQPGPPEPGAEPDPPEAPRFPWGRRLLQLVCVLIVADWALDRGADVGLLKGAATLRHEVVSALSPGGGCGDVRPVKLQEARFWQAAKPEVNVRAGPGTTWDAVAGLERGAVAKLGGEIQGEWLTVRLRDGRRGWVRADLGHLWAEPGCGLFFPRAGLALEEEGHTRRLRFAAQAWLMKAEEDPTSPVVLVAPGVRATVTSGDVAK